MPFLCFNKDDKPASELDWVVEQPAVFAHMNYSHRGEALKDMSFYEYLTGVELRPKHTNKPELENVREFLDMGKYKEVREMAQTDEGRQALEVQFNSLTEGLSSDEGPLRFFLEEIQLKHCAYCGKHATRRCTACRSFVYCCEEHQHADWKQKHKHVCLKRKNW